MRIRFHRFFSWCNPDVGEVLYDLSRYCPVASGEGIGGSGSQAVATTNGWMDYRLAKPQPTEN